MKPQLCLTVSAPTTSALRAARDAAVEADLVELRLDSVADPDVAGALAGRRTPVLVTCRPPWEGGHFSGSEEERRRLLEQALQLGAEFVDLEWRGQFDDVIARERGRRIVLSVHDFDGVPCDLLSRAEAMRMTGAEIVKIAAQTNRLSDCVPLLELGSKHGCDGGLVVVGMGDHGLATRVLPARFESRWTYAGVQRHIGQVPSSELIGEYRFRATSSSTALYGVTGAPVSHSVSPAMHNAAFRAEGIDAVYLPLPAVDAEDFVAFSRAFGLKGASVTIPHKVALMRHVAEASTLARRIGALNTIRVNDGRWIGENTDVSGFAGPLESHLSLKGQRAAILGAGGSARAAAMALSARGARVTVHGRTPARAAAVADTVHGTVGSWPPAPQSWDVLVNCTPIGMYPNVGETPVAAESLTGRLVYDLVYNPQETRLLREAAAAGCDTIGGLEMLVAQAQEQFKWWTGVMPSGEIMRAAAVACLSRFTAAREVQGSEVV